MRRSTLCAAALLAAPLLAACRQDMHDQPHHEPQEVSTFFPDQRADRPQVPGTVARGGLRLDEQFYTGKVDGKLADTFPIPVDRALLERGQERYGIFCSACHDYTGSGRGMVVRRGMKQPTSFHAQRLLDEPPGYFYDVITNGFGAMYDYREKIPPRDRWAIIAYVRALQLSQNTPLADLTDEERARLVDQ